LKALNSLLRQSKLSAIAVCLALMVCGLLAPNTRGADDKTIGESWDYVPSMKKIAAGFKGKTGVVLHIGDSITYSNPYGQWARYGKGRTNEDKAILKWMHAGANDATDGWYLARVDRPGGRSDTACSGIRADQMLAGGKSKMPALKDMLGKYQPQMVVLMLGTNDASANRKLDAFTGDMTKAVDLVLGRGAICILSTIPPHPKRLELAASYNKALRDLAKKRGLPLIDFEAEILNRRPKDWNGTLLGKGDVHPTSKSAGTGAADAPTPQNLRNSGYLLRCWLSVRKIAQVKKRVIDAR
jgi:lysophospholipase L1-like esterase